jgi:hypothetical protein
MEPESCPAVPDPRTGDPPPRAPDAPDARTLFPIEGGITVDIGKGGLVRVVVTGLDVVGKEDPVPMLVNMNPDEARELAQALIDAARRTEAE